MPSHVHAGFPPLFTLALTVVALVYSRGWYRLQKAFPKALPGWRVVAFMGGLISTWAAAGSPVATLDHHLLTAHMAQHLLLMTIAAPLILLGALNRRQAFHGIVIHPALCWLAGTATVIAWHIPSLFELGMRSPQWHRLEQATFLA